MNPSTSDCAAVEPGGAPPRRLEQPREVVELVAHLLGEREHRLLDVAEVLVEGRRRGADPAGDVDHREVEDARGGEELGGGVEQAPAGELGPAAEAAAVDGHQVRGAHDPSAYDAA